MTWQESMRNSGYEPITMFWDDFSIAERFGHDAIRNTYYLAVKAWYDDYKYLTELVMVLNHKIWQHHKTDEPTAKVYEELWNNADRFVSNYLKGEELDYYNRITD